MRHRRQVHRWSFNRRVYHPIAASTPRHHNIGVLWDGTTRTGRVDRHRIDCDQDHRADWHSTPCSKCVQPGRPVWMRLPTLSVCDWSESNCSGSSGPHFRPQKFETCPVWGAKALGVDSIRRANAQNCQLIYFRVRIPIGSEATEWPAPLSIACFACPSRLRRPQLPACAFRSQFQRSGAIQPPGARSSLERGPLHLARTPLVRGQAEAPRITPVSAFRRPQVR